MSHPSIIQGLDGGFDMVSDECYIALEALRGPTLGAIARRRTFTQLEVAQIGLHMASALVALHHAGIVHRDIKLDNTMLTGGDPPWVVIFDFGVAFFTDPSRQISAHEPMLRTGTPPYMAPEILGGGAASHLSDEYALGVVLYVLLTRQFPFQSRHQLQLSSSSRRALKATTRTDLWGRREDFGFRSARPPSRSGFQRFIPLTEAWPTIGRADALSEALVNIIHRLLMQNPTRRFPTPDQLVTALEHVIHELR